ncbi:putative methyltransferase [Actinoplanes ianthinogenes]|uniref:Methyltransferase n=1 Tax=Actinoplanes ianthinogenes TaxID=122358 RepID=A0ABM7M5I0_9ACTN|nr:class I SAM-dependent methyltransferase [Actinoplanes ianthinogenes]BCJ46884.1 putative methyltransferase [Actinoplanes ianthinogenes]GGR14867.1 putative methyltransferase [Actinoplanes ianthinogenes]
MDHDAAPIAGSSPSSVTGSVAAASFGSAAGAYERGRPPYPETALDFLLPAGSPRVLDLGAGTGKLTRQIRARDLDVIAVDPSEAMLAELRRAVPGVPAHLGTAENLPLPDASVDVVLVAQAWHWVDPARALPEIARVLTPGGRLGLIWNVRDESTDWVHRLGTVIGRDDRARDSTMGPPFGPVTTTRIGWTHTLRPDELLDLVASRSNVILLPVDERAAVLAQVRQLIATHPALLGRDSYALPYVTECAYAELPTA